MDACGCDESFDEMRRLILETNRPSIDELNTEERRHTESVHPSLQTQSGLGVAGIVR